MCLVLIGVGTAVERHFLSRDAQVFCDRFEIGTPIETLTGFVGQQKMEVAYINDEWGYRFRWWDWLGMGAEACSMWFENGVLVRKKRHADLA